MTLPKCPLGYKPGEPNYTNWIRRRSFRRKADRYNRFGFWCMLPARLFAVVSLLYGAYGVFVYEEILGVFPMAIGIAVLSEKQRRI